MISIKKDYTRIPPALISAKAERWIKRALDERSDHKPSDDVYRDREVVDYLKKIYNGKCGYCESRLTGKMQIDHYRPKGNVKQDKKCGGRGYYWLAYEWSNFILSCDGCNGEKSSLFPLENEHNRVCEPPKDRRDWNAGQGPMRAETPLLLNPELDRPEEHLDLNEEGEVLARNGSRRGETTTELLDLNRELLLLERYEIIKERRTGLIALATFIRDVKSKEIKRKEELWACIENMFSKEFSFLKSRTDPKTPYSLLADAMLRKFSTFVIDKVEDADIRNILRKAYKTCVEKTDNEFRD